MLLCLIFVDIDYMQSITLFIGLAGGGCFGGFLLSKAFDLTGNMHKGSGSVLTREDAMVGFIRLIYADFGFVLLIGLLVMLGTLKSLPMLQESQDVVTDPRVY